MRLDETVAIEVEARDPDFALAEVRLHGEAAGRTVLDETLLGRGTHGPLHRPAPVHAERARFAGGRRRALLGHRPRQSRSAAERSRPAIRRRCESSRPIRDSRANRRRTASPSAKSASRRTAANRKKASSNKAKADNPAANRIPPKATNSNQASPLQRTGNPAKAANKTPPTAIRRQQLRRTIERSIRRIRIRRQIKRRRPILGRRTKRRIRRSPAAAGRQLPAPARTAKPPSKITSQQPSGGEVERRAERCQSVGRANPAQTANSTRQVSAETLERQPGNSGQSKPGNESSPVSPEGDNDGEAFDRIQEFLKREGKLPKRRRDQERVRVRRRVRFSGRATKAKTASVTAEPNGERDAESNPDDQADPNADAKSEQPGAEARPGDSPEKIQRARRPRQQVAILRRPSRLRAKANPAPAISQNKVKGSPEAQPNMKPGDKWQQKPSGEKQGDQQEPPSGGHGKRESDSQGDQGGDRSGGGEEGGGQKSNRDGTGSAGQNQSADEGAGESSEQGAGRNSPNAGQDATVERPHRPKRLRRKRRQAPPSATAKATNRAAEPRRHDQQGSGGEDAPTRSERRARFSGRGPASKTRQPTNQAKQSHQNNPTTAPKTPAPAPPTAPAASPTAPCRRPSPTAPPPKPTPPTSNTPASKPTSCSKRSPSR